MRPVYRACAVLAGIGALLLAGTLLLSPGPAIPGGQVGPLRGEIREERGGLPDATPVVPGARIDSREPESRPASSAGQAPDPTTAPVREARTRSFGRSLELVTWESIAAEGLPAPPPEFTASPFRWRLKHPIERERLDGFVRQMKILSVDERTSLLQKVRRSKDPHFGVVLLAELPSIPDNPVTIFDYASAMIETAAAPAGGERPVPPRDLASAALALLAGRTTKYGSVLQESAWEGIRVKLERLGEVDPPLLRDPASGAAMAEIRRDLGTALEKALSREVGYLGGVACFRLAAQFGDEGTHEILCSLLKEWDSVRTRFPTGGLSEPTAHLYAVESLLRPPCAAHAAQGIDALIARFRVSGAGGEMTRFENRIRRYAADRGLDEGLRRRLYSELGEEFREAPPPSVPPRSEPPEPPRTRDEYR